MIEVFKKYFENIAIEVFEIEKREPKTKDILKYFGKMGDEKGYYVRPLASEKGKRREWLYDLVWQEIDNKNLISLNLAMEIEFSDQNLNGILYDFNKLLQSESDFKILVYKQKDKERTINSFAFFRNAIYEYKNKSKNSYLLCCLDKKIKSLSLTK